MKKEIAAALLILGSLFIIVSCSSPKDDPKAAAEDLFSAQAAGDWGRYCQLITETSARLTVDLIAYKSKNKSISCPKAISSLPKKAEKPGQTYSQAELSASAKDVRVGEEIARNGNQVVLEIVRSGAKTKLLLVEEGGAWRVVLPVELQQLNK